MVTQRQGYAYCFDCALEKKDIKHAIKNELYNSFEIKEDASINALIQYLMDNFFWELFYHFKDELRVTFGENNINCFGGEFL